METEPAMTPLILLALQEAPEVISYLKTLFHTRHPDEPAPTDAEVIAAFNAAFASSIARDDQWRTAHPE